MNNTLTKSSKIQKFEQLIAPHTLDFFSNNYWDKNVLYIERKDPEFYDSLFSMDRIDLILNLSNPTGENIRIVREQQELDKTKYVKLDGNLNLNQIYVAYADGYTVVINGINQFWKPLKDLCQNLYNELHHKTVANMYLTPKNQKALLPHYDTHDVFVVQVSGKKHWTLYDPTYPAPLVNSYQPIFQREQLKGKREITVQAGDIMYIPRGVPHEAMTTDESSLHLTIGVYPTQWLDIIAKSLEGMAQSNLLLRKALPINFQTKLAIETIGSVKEELKGVLDGMLEPIGLETAKYILAEEYRAQQIAAGDGHFGSLDQVSLVSIETVVVQRDNMNCKVQQIGIYVRIVFLGNIIKGPATLSTAFQYIANNTDNFKVSSIPGISNKHKVKIVQRLIRGGLLKIIKL